MKRIVHTAIFLFALVTFSSHTHILEKASKFFSSALIFSTAPTLPITPFNYANPSLPNFFNGSAISNTDNTPMDNPISDAGATLGRVLFYDVNLSQNNTTSCGTCHRQAQAFGEPTTVSTGFNGGMTTRNSPHLSNARYYTSGKFFLDERAATLEGQVLEPIENAIEMGEDLSTLPAKLAALGYYDDLFIDAFGDAAITTDRMSKAMAQFVRSMVSYQSKYDAGAPNGGPPTGTFANFTADENDGKLLFEQHCDNCHKTALQITDDVHNIGLTDGTGGAEDLGVGAVTGLSNDDGKFKVPSLRNIELTAPYMHDGSLATLADVIEHYNSGVQNHPNLAGSLKSPGPGGGTPNTLNLTATEKLQLEDFLKTLTDDSFVTDTKFSDPFASVLPVEFVDFQARIDAGAFVDLEWTTATEINNELFEVQHSTNGADFEAIHFEESKTAVDGYHYYQFRDNTPSKGQNYYRIKQIDFDGKFTFSAVKTVYIQQPDLTKINVYPTATKDLIFVKIESGTDKEVTVFISNSNGQIVDQLAWSLESGVSTFRIDSYDWKKGLHFLIINDGNEQKQFRVIKS